MERTYTVRILNSSFTGLCELDDFRSLEFTRRWQRPNELVLNVSQYSPQIAHLADGNYVEIRKNNTPLLRLLIAEKGVNLTEEGKLSELWEMIGINIIARRICLPPAGTAEEHFNGPGETILRSLIDRNIINPADANRTIPNITLEIDLGRGTVLEDIVARYEGLAEKLEEVCRGATLGWELTPVDGGLSFHVIPGVDRSASQFVRPQVIFSPDRGNIRILGYRTSKIGRANLAYVGGSGEGAAREMETAYLEAVEPTGINRIETFVNASDTTGTIPIVQRGEAELDAQGPLERLEAEVLLPDGLEEGHPTVTIIEDTQAEFATGTLTRCYAEIAGYLGLRGASLWEMFHGKSLWSAMGAP